MLWSNLKTVMVELATFGREGKSFCWKETRVKDVNTFVAIKFLEK